MNDAPSILYVEDDPLSREIMELLLKEVMGIADVTILPDSSEFMTHLKKMKRKPDVVLLDIHIRPHDGFAMLKMMREDVDYKETRAIAFTASVMNQEVQQLRVAGFNGAIAKPVDFDTFPQTLSRILAGEYVWRIDS